VEPNLTVARHAATRDLLGAFALGAVDAEEAATVRAHLATCAECQAEIAELWLAVDSLPDMIEPMEPPPALRDRIATAIAAEAASPLPAPSASPAPEPMPAIAPVPPATEPIRKPASFWSRATPWAAAAAILLLLSAGLLVWNLRLREQIATAPVAETIALAPTDVAPEARGEVTYLPQDDLFMLEVRDLPPLEPDQVY
jgi:anti-sigma factor RsiW